MCQVTVVKQKINEWSLSIQNVIKLIRDVTEIFRMQQV